MNAAAFDFRELTCGRYLKRTALTFIGHDRVAVGGSHRYEPRISGIRIGSSTSRLAQTRHLVTENFYELLHTGVILFLYGNLKGLTVLLECCICFRKPFEFIEHLPNAMKLHSFSHGNQTPVDAPRVRAIVHYSQYIGVDQVYLIIRRGFDIAQCRREPFLVLLE